MITVKDQKKKSKARKKKMRIKSAFKNSRKRKLNNWYYKKYKVSKGMNPFQGSKLRNKLVYDHRTGTIPKTTIKNNVINGLLQQENEVQ